MSTSGDSRRGEPVPVQVPPVPCKGDLWQALLPADTLRQGPRPPDQGVLRTKVPGGGQVPPMLGVQEGPTLREEGEPKDR